MIAVFARLKLRLLWNTLRHGQGLGLVLFTFLAGGLSFAATSLALARPVDELTLALPLVALVLVVSALLAPLLFGSTDETVDTTRLALFPLDSLRLAQGMATASLIGPGPLALLVPLAAVATRAPDLGSTVAGLAAAITTVVLVALLPKLVMSVFGALLRRRRSRDLATVASSLLVAVAAIAGQALTVVWRSVDRRHVEVASAGAEVLPTGWPARALALALEGRVLPSLAFLAASWLLIVYLVVTWARILRRSLSEVDDSVSDTDLAGHLLRSASERPRVVMAVLAKEWRYLRRHPRYRVQVISQAMVVFIGGVPFIGAVLDRRPEAVLLGCIPGLTAGLTGANLLGPDGRALWAEAIALPSLRPLLRARSLVFAGLGTAGSVLVTLAAAAVTGGWSFVVPALAAGVGMSATGAGIGSITSTLAPVPYPEESNPNPFASGLSGGGCVNGLVSFVGVLIGLVAAVPILIAIANATDGNVLLLVLITVLSPAYGIAMWFGATTLAGRRVDTQIPELVTALSRAG